MFERFTGRGRQVIVLAQEEARALRHNYVGTEHFLLGLLREEDGIAAKALASLGITVDPVRDRVVRMVGSGEEDTAGQIPFTPLAKKVLELSLRESRSLGHNHIGTEHILLALVREGDGVAARILRDLDADAQTVRSEVIRVLSGPQSLGPSERRAAVRHGLIDPFWAGELSPVLEIVAAEIRSTLGRTPDTGDLLVALACAPEVLAGRALADLGVDVDALCRAVDRLRDEVDERHSELERQADEARQAKEEALAAGDFARAAELRDRERELSIRKRRAGEARPELLEEIRRRLGLAPPKSL